MSQVKHNLSKSYSKSSIIPKCFPVSNSCNICSLNIVLAKFYRRVSAIAAINAQNKSTRVSALLKL